MKSTLRLLFALSFGLGLISFAHAADISGKWQSDFDSQVGAQKYLFTFKVDGETLTGTAAGERNGEKSLVAIQKGKVTADTITFVEPLKIQDQDIMVEYTGKLTNDNEIKFTRKVGDFASYEIVAKRVQDK